MDTKKLTQDEMDALLESPDGDSGAKGGDAKGSPMIYDFRRPDRVPKGMLRSLQAMHESFCSNASASLSGYFRLLSEVTITSVEQTNFSEFVQGMTDPTCLTLLSLRPLNGTAVLEMSLDLAFPLIDRLLGGPGQAPDSSRKMTEIEKNVIQGVVRLITAEFQEAWKPCGEASFHIQGSEIRPQLLQTTAPADVVIVFAFDVKIGEMRGTVNLCVPFSTLEPISGKFEQEAEPHRKADSSDFAKLARNLLKIPLEISSELPRTYVTLDDLLRLTAGDIIKLDPKVDDLIELCVGGRAAFQATLLEVNGHKGAGVVRRLAE
jgi:flagellar motor switch protein FliM